MLDQKRLRKLHWIDTRDMCSDGLNKGTVDRIAIHNVIEKNIWRQQGDDPCTVTAFIGLHGIRISDENSDWSIMYTGENASGT